MIGDSVDEDLAPGEAAAVQGLILFRHVSRRQNPSDRLTNAEQFRTVVAIGNHEIARQRLVDHRHVVDDEGVDEDVSESIAIFPPNVLSLRFRPYGWLLLYMQHNHFDIL